MHRLVVIDDEFMVVEGIKALLKRQNLDYEVVGSAHNGIDGLEVVREQKPDLVITDIRMPGLDGLSLIEEARETCPDTTFVVISGYTEFEYARRALNLGVRGYIDKPISVDKLNQVLERVEQEWKEQKPERSLGFSAGSEFKARSVQKQGLRIEADHSTGAEQSVSFKQEAGEGKGFGTEPDRGSVHPVIADLLSYIDSHYQEDIGLSELADRVKMSTAYLSVLFKTEVGTSFIKYLTALRVTKAKELLERGLKVKDVSEQVGYSNYRYFCDIFKKSVGQTPQEFKEHNR